jgi:SAM-dependent methyltransferase
VHTSITHNNPYGYDRYGFAWQNTPSGGEAHLDFGCNTGSFLSSLRSKGIGRLVGVDISRDSVYRARNEFSDLEISHILKTVPLPFEDCTFTSITVLDVLEHICEQNDLLSELNRVLSDSGVLIVTVPRKHIFSFLDLGNFKFRFPKLHRWYYCRNHTKEEYGHRYVQNPDGLVGDVSAQKLWHEHFTRASMKRLLDSSGFVVIDFDGTGFFSRFIGVFVNLSGWSNSLQKVFKRIGVLDAKLFESTNLFCVASKQN